MPGDPLVPEPDMMLIGAVAHVGVPSIAGMPARQPAHELVTNLLGHHAGGGDRRTVRIAIHQRLVRVTNFRERQSVHQDLPAVEASEGALQRSAADS